MAKTNFLPHCKNCGATIISGEGAGHQNYCYNCGKPLPSSPPTLREHLNTLTDKELAEWIWNNDGLFKTTDGYKKLSEEYKGDK